MFYSFHLIFPQKLKDKNAQLETSLSAETKLKMDLFSALGEAKRQFSIVNGMFLF